MIGEAEAIVVADGTNMTDHEKKPDSGPVPPGQWPIPLTDEQKAYVDSHAAAALEATRRAIKDTEQRGIDVSRFRRMFEERYGEEV